MTRCTVSLGDTHLLPEILAKTIARWDNGVRVTKQATVRNISQHVSTRLYSRLDNRVTNLSLYGSPVGMYLEKFCNHLDHRATNSIDT